MTSNPTRLITLLLTGLLLAGCSSHHKQTKSEKARMNAEFAKIDLAIANSTLGAGPSDEPTLEGLTHRYVRTTRKWADDLGDKRVRQRLADEADALQPWCPPCVEILYRERERY